MKIYNSDNWFYKQGLVGFHRIIQYNKDFYDLDPDEYCYKVYEDYIEFEDSLLSHFHKYYFNYFLGRYNSAEEQGEKIKYYFNQCKNPDKFKDNLKYAKDIVKKNNDKIKKFGMELYDEYESIYKELGSIKKIEELENVERLLNRYIQLLREESVNSRITLNKFKALLSGNFFGQVSFLNVTHTSKTLEEQQNILFKDYVLPIIEMNKLKEVLDENDEEFLKEFINNREVKDKKQENEVDLLIKKISGDLFGKKRKEKCVEKVIEKYSICSMCEDEISLGSDYSEGNFIPLALSNANSKNMFWDLQARYPICNVCKLILLCTAAGSTDIFKSYLDEKYGYNDKTYFGFVSIDGDLEELIKQNNNFQNRNDKKSSFESYILDSIAQKGQISKWQLENILYVEFNTDYNSKNSKMNYFNVPTYLAKFLKNNNGLMYEIKDLSLRMEVFDTILSRKDLKHVIDKKLRENLVESNKLQSNVLGLIKIRSCLKLYKGECEMVDISFDKKLKFLYMQGFEIADKLRSTGQENKIQGLSYRLLNSTKASNKKEFMDTIIRIFMSVEKEVPMVFLEVIKERDLDFEEVAHSFIAGLTSKGKYKGKEKGDN